MSKKMFVALPLGGLLDRAAMGTEKDVEVSPHKPIAVPAAYGRSLVENRFAIEVDAEAGKKPQLLPGSSPARTHLMRQKSR